MRILISGGAGARNAGDEALLRAAVQFCETSFPGAHLAYLANNAEVAAETLAGFRVTMAPSPRIAFFRADDHYASADTVFMHRWWALHSSLVGKSLDDAVASLGALPFVDPRAAEEVLRRIAACDLFLVHGGGILTSATRSRLWEQSLVVEIAAGLGKPVFLRSHQLGPFTDQEDRNRAHMIAYLARLITTRDKDQSRRAMLQIAPKARHIVDQVDDALLLESDDVADRAVLASHGLTDRGYICVGYRSNPNVGIDEHSFRKTADIVRAAYERTSAPIVLLPQGPFDEWGLGRLSDFLGVEAKLLKSPGTMQEPMAIAAHARLMIACPHHSLIFALRGSVPVISPSMGAYYLFKNIGSLRHFGLEDFVIDISQEPADFMPQVAVCLDRIMADEMSFRSALRDRVEILKQEARRGDARFAADVLRELERIREDADLFGTLRRARAQRADT
jgi:polysaccharide pyruvyl transferase WcaK-like protein